MTLYHTRLLAGVDVMMTGYGWFKEGTLTEGSVVRAEYRGKGRRIQIQMDRNGLGFRLDEEAWRRFEPESYHENLDAMANDFMANLEVSLGG